VYRAVIDLDQPQEEYAFELVGFGHYAGRTGSLYTDFFATDPADRTWKHKFEKAPLMVESLIARIDPTSYTTTISSAATTTVPGGTSTTTTAGAGRRKLCPAKKLLSAHDSQNMLDLLRRFRDQRLLQSAAGRSLTARYYAHAEELALILACRPAMADTCRQLLAHAAGAIAASLRSGTPLKLSIKEYYQGMMLLHLLCSEASPLLRADLFTVLQHLRKSELAGIKKNR
jgi:hypothetical protein